MYIINIYEVPLIVPNIPKIMRLHNVLNKIGKDFRKNHAFEYYLIPSSCHIYVSFDYDILLHPKLHLIFNTNCFYLIESKTPSNIIRLCPSSGLTLVSPHVFPPTCQYFGKKGILKSDFCKSESI